MPNHIITPQFLETQRRDMLADDIQQEDADNHLADYFSRTISKEEGEANQFTRDLGDIRASKQRGGVSALLDSYAYGTTQPTERFAEPVEEPIDPTFDVEQRTRETIGRAASGEQPLLSTAQQLIGETIEGTFATGFEPVEKIFKAVTTEGFREKLGKAFASAIERDPVIGNLLQALSSVQGRIEEIKDPVLKEDAKALLSVLSVLPVGGAAVPVLKAAGTVVAPVVRGGVRAVGATARGVTGTIRGVTKFATKQITGLDDATINYIVRHSDFDPKISPEVLRGDVGKQFSDVLGDFQSAERGLLPEYAPIRSDVTNKVVFSVNNDPLIKKIESKGFVVTHTQTDAGIKFRVTKSAKSRIPLKKGELSKLEELLDLASGNRVLTNDEFLNIRGELTDLSKFDATGEVTKNLQSLAREMRADWNVAGRRQISGLKELDAQFSGLERMIEDFAGDFTKFDKRTGRIQLTDTGYRKLLNITNRGRERELARLKEFMPDIENQLNLIRAVEDVQIAGGQKVGTYARALIVGGGGGAVLGGPVGAVMGFILASPSVSVPLLRVYGKIVGGIDNVIKSITGKLKTGTKLNAEEAKVFSDSVEHFAVIEQSGRASEFGESRLAGLRGAEDSSFRESLSRFLSVEEKLTDTSVAGKAGLVFGGSDLHPVAKRALKEMGFEIADNPELIKLVPDEQLDLVLEFMRQNQANVADKVAKIAKGESFIGENRLAGLKTVGGVDFPVFEGFDDLSTSIVEGLKGRTRVSKQFIQDLTNQGSVKQFERELIRSTLDEFGDTIPVKDFAVKVRQQLLPLDKVHRQTTPSGASANISKWEGTNLPDELRGDIDQYFERVYSSPIKNSAGSIHNFDDITDAYFAHTRVDDMADNITRRVVEIQSDLFQKGGLKRAVTEEGAGLSESQIANRVKLTGLEPYRNTWHERIIKEEIKQASIDGKTKLQIPTGETAMKIEGLGDAINTRWRTKGNQRILKSEDLKVGDVINSDGQSDWIITDVLGDGKFKAVPSDFSPAAGMSARDIMRGNNQRLIGQLDIRAEAFDISGKVDTSNPIFRFYEKTIQKYLKNFRTDMKRIKDDKGIEWFELPIKPEDAKIPVLALKQSSAIA